jgi:hypothetical protein
MEIKNILKEKQQLIQFILLVFGVILGIILLVVVGSTLIRMISGNTEGQDQQNLPITLGAQTSANFLDPQAAARSIFIPDIIFPSEVDRFWDVPWIHSRERKTQWSLADVQQFWYDPVTIGTETLSNQNRQRVRQWLQTID